MTDRIITEALYQQVVEALEDVDALIKRRFSGTREGMSALQNACNDALAALAALSTAPQAQPIDTSADTPDAARYRFIRSELAIEDGMARTKTGVQKALMAWWPGIGPIDSQSDADIDKAIDAALQAQQPKEKP